MQDQTVWTFDAGNSAVKAKRFEGRRCTHRYTWSRDEAWDFVRQPPAELPQAHLAGVACPHETDRELLSALFYRLAPSANPLFVRHGMQTPFSYRYTSGAPGPDRLANAMALQTLFPGRPAAAIDFGTATHTVVIDAQGNFLGGTIAPGVETMGRSLQHATRGVLPLPEFEAAPPGALSFPADSTTEAIRSGILLCQAGILDRVAESMATRFPGAEPSIVATGGWAPLVLRHAGKELRREPDLTALGLAAFAEWFHGRE